MVNLLNLAFLSIVVVIVAERIFKYIRFKYFKNKSHHIFQEYVNLFTCLPLGIALYDKYGKLLESNKYAVSDLNFPEKGELRDDFNLFDFGLFTAQDKCAIMAGTFNFAHKEYAVKFKDSVGSQIKKLYCLVKTIYNNAGCADSYLLILIDNTDVNEVNKQETQLSTLLDDLMPHMPIPLYIKEVGKDIKHVYWNKAAIEQSGRTIDEVVGKNNIEIFGEQQGKRFDELDSDLIKKEGTKAYYGQSFDINDKVSLKANMINTLVKQKDGTRYILATNWDVTDRINKMHQIEVDTHNLSLSLEAAKIIPWTWDVENDIITIDYSYSVASSWVRSHVINKFDFNFVLSKVHPDDIDRLQTKVADLCMGVVDRIRIEVRIALLEGRYNWFGIYALTEKREGGSLYIVGSAINANKRKWAENKLLRSKEQVEEASRLKIDFLSNVSYEVRTPLNAIVGFSGLLAVTESKKDRLQYLEIIDNNKELLLKFVNDVLDISRIEAGLLELSYSIIDINAMLDETYQLYSFKYPNDKVHFVLSKQLNNCLIVSDAVRLMQVIRNFVTNSVRYTKSGSIHFGYTVSPDKFYFYVKDTGTGIPTDKLNLLFERFVKLDEHSQGTGLGLFISKKVIEKLGGEIGVESTEGKGSLFWFTLPYAPMDKKDHQGYLVNENLKLNPKLELVTG